MEETKDKLPETSPVSGEATEYNSFQDRRKKAPGVINRKMQSWIVLGIAVVMGGIVLFGGNTKPAKTKQGETQTTVSGMSPDEVARGLRDQQQQAIEAEKERQAATTHDPNATLVPGGNGRYEYTPPPVPTEADSMAQELRKRSYTSLYASNVALSYRSARIARPARGEAAGGQQVPLQMAGVLPPAFPFPLTPGQGGLPGDPSNPAQSASQASAPHRKTVNLDQAEGKDFVLYEGAVLETVLVNRLNSDFVGPVLVMVTSDVYSHDRLHVLIPSGSKLIGDTRKVDGFGQTRLAVVFHRLLMPDGFTVDLDQLPGLDQVGDTALHDQVNNHYFKIFGASIAVGVMGGLTQFNTQPPALGVSQSQTDIYRQGAASGFAKSSDKLLDRYLNILPTITIREGHRVKVFLTEDLMLPAYENHTMPSDL